MRLAPLLVLLVGCSFDPQGIQAVTDSQLFDAGSGDTGEIADGPSQVDARRAADAEDDTLPSLDGASDVGSTPHLLKLTFKNKSRGEALVDFVALVTLTPARFNYQAAASKGADLRFVDSDGVTALPHEIERWVPGGTSVVWVRVPKIDAGSDTDFITLHYGDPAAGKPQDPHAVWASSQIAVYHLADDPGLPPPQVRDSTASTFHGTAKGSIAASSQIDGRIGGALELKASTKDRIEIGDKEPLNVDPGEVRTLQACFRTATTSTKGHFLQKEGYCQGWAVSVHDTGEVLGRLAVGTGCPNIYQSYHAGSWGRDLADKAWHHVAFVIDRAKGTARLFVDGKPVDSVSIDTSLNAANGVAKIGSNFDDSETFDGAIDEVRISGSARSADWIDAEYASMTDALLVYGSPSP